MGVGNSCFSEPQSFQLGWTSSKAFNNVTLPAGSWETVSLPAPTRSSASGLRIETGTWATGTKPVVVGYRNGEKFDYHLESQYKDKVHIYYGNTASNYDKSMPGFVTSLTVGQSYTVVR